MSQNTEPLPGTADIFPTEAAAWRLMEQAAHQLFPRYGYGELRTPIFERTEVFQRSIGEETDVVQKEMYTFPDRGGRSLTLRPEGTAGVIRALAHAGLEPGDERRVYYLGPMFRGERPAAGRRRQFHQIGAECVGKCAPELDVECIELLMTFLAELGITDVQLLLNTRGVAAERPPVAQALRDFFAPRLGELCEDCQRRLTSNVWRILDCKVEGCRAVVVGAPPVTELFGQETREYFARVARGLDQLGRRYTLEPRLVRGLDYYCHTVFEVTSAQVGAQNSIAGGGRYEITFDEGGQPVPGVGFGVGLERLLMIREALGLNPPAGPAAELFLVSLGAAALARNMLLAKALRATGWRVLMDLEGRGLKAQLRAANKCGAGFALILGDRELAQESVVCKDLRASTQETVALAQVADYLAARRGAS